MAGSLKEKLIADMKQALKDGDKKKRGVLQMVTASIQNAEIAKKAALEDIDVIGILAKEAKQHEESIEAFKQGNRADLVAIEESELVILAEYLPEQASHDEVVATAQRIINEIGAEGPRDKGKVMPKIIAELKGKADGREINDVVTGLLGS